MMFASLTAHFLTDAGRDNLGPSHAEITMQFTSREEMESFAAKLPKSLRARTGYFLNPVSGDRAWIEIRVKLAPVKGNERNETGIKRLRAAEAKLTALGVCVKFDADRAYNSYQTRADFDAAIA